MHIVRVFVDKQGMHGNPVGIVVDEALDFSEASRQKMALESHLSEVVFINNLSQGVIHIYSPLREIPFAGHAAIGAAKFISGELGKPVSTLLGIDGPIKTWKDASLTWVSCPLAMLPPWQLIQHASVDAVNTISAHKIKPDAHALHWTWIDEQNGLVRARTFAPAWGIAEDEANGSGAMKLANNMQKPLKLIHGQGSIIYANPAGDNLVQVGGQVRLE
jgi:predicted PhzF superfamily epimerase YddE/YHI9